MASSVIVQVCLFVNALYEWDVTRTNSCVQLNIIALANNIILLFLPLMTIGHKAGHYCHFRVLCSANSDTGSKKEETKEIKKKKKKLERKKEEEKFWDLLGRG